MSYLAGEYQNFQGNRQGQPSGNSGSDSTGTTVGDPHTQMEVIETLGGNCQGQPRGDSGFN
jgi:hypothetical protein